MLPIADRAWEGGGWRSKHACCRAEEVQRAALHFVRKSSEAGRRRSAETIKIRGSPTSQLKGQSAAYRFKESFLRVFGIRGQTRSFAHSMAFRPCL
jgi:hypothetical protein